MPVGPNQIAGALLEEAVLAVLSAAGFIPVESVLGDPSINPNRPPVTIRGRGTDHQIDAVADPVVGYPFSNPARLLVEAKAYSRSRVGLDVIRNAVGTLKDVSEFWRPADNGAGSTRRYHYRYAVFSTTEFTRGAQRYAYAQDIYLMPLRRSAFFRPIVDAIKRLRTSHSRTNLTPVHRGRLSEYRARFRRALRGEEPPAEFEGLIAAVRRVRYGLIAVADRQFPIFLVPKGPQVISQLKDVETVRFFWDNRGWYLRRASNNEDLFSFDLPDDLFALYATGRGLERVQALHLKAERLGILQAIVVQGTCVRVIQFMLDEDWIEKLLAREGC